MAQEIELSVLKRVVLKVIEDLERRGWRRFRVSKNANFYVDLPIDQFTDIGGLYQESEVGSIADDIDFLKLEAENTSESAPYVLVHALGILKLIAEDPDQHLKK
jgi:hypothetical protein